MKRKDNNNEKAPFKLERGSKRQKAAYRVTKNQIKEPMKNIKAECPWNLVPKEGDPNNKGRKYTVSVAIPGSVIEIAQSAELRTYLAGEIARAVTIFEVDEVIIYNEDPTRTMENTTSGVYEGSNKPSDPNIFLARILQYLETPSYLRKLLFPVHKDLQYTGLLNPLDAPHHMRLDETSLYREGVTIDKPVKQGAGSFVTCGLRKDVKIDKHIKPGVRVTVELDLDLIQSGDNVKNYKGKVVSPRQPREKHGLYWGYQIRLAKSISDVFKQSSFGSKANYDLTIGISDHGDNAYTTCSKLLSSKNNDDSNDNDDDDDNDDIKNNIPSTFNHLLIVFGGQGGIENAVEVDENIKINRNDTRSLFDLYLNTCPYKGSRAIRLEEQILITMSTLKTLIQQKGAN
ncbi:putative RNA methyltransferase [Neocallimastix sp. 'constans']